MSVAIKTDGTLWSWGKNNNGQLGQGDVINRSSPVQVGSLTDWSKISSGIHHVVSIKTNGTLWSWGAAEGGALGLGVPGNKSSPVQVGSLTDWSTIDAADNWTVAYKSDSSIWVWGKDNDAGDMAQGDSSINRSSPVQIGSLTTWESVTAGKLTGGALKG
jgi:alpha-tubulin suppressor-like RCC1 family protein